MKKSFLVILFMMFFLTGCYETTTAVPDRSITWQDADGTLLGTTFVYYGAVPEYDLPQDTEAWDYLNWSPEITPAYADQVYTANREIKDTFFVGNIFQIIVYDLGNVAISTGSGFVFNDQGWFITNDHVMDEGYFAQAIFDIPDTLKGESYTKLDIDLASYRHTDNDVIIGKITGYSRISTQYYQDFLFTTEYDVDDKTYSVGYPNSSTKLQVHEGKIISDLSSIYDKVYGGVIYIGSTSYIAPGSSGGILVNEKLEILGMTTISIVRNLTFVVGGSIEALNYMGLVSSVNTSDLKDYAVFMHPDEKEFIGYFKEAMDDPDASRKEFDDYVRYTYTWEGEGTNDTGDDYTYEEILIIDSDMWMEYSSSYYWGDGSRREESFYGYYSVEDGLKNFTYEVTVTYSSGQYYTLKSTNINYSSNLSLTLNQYTTTKSYGITISSEMITYAKEMFNSTYEWLTEDMARFK